MKTLTIDDKKAREIYPSAASELKTILEETFGKPFFFQKITDRVRTFEDACKITGENLYDLKFINGTPDDVAFQKLKVIAKALNEGWAPDWNNGSQKKYYPWFRMNNGFRLDRVYCYFSVSNVGSRLCFKSEELARYAVAQFESFYKDFFTY